MNIGVREDERAHPQEIILNMECEVDFSKALLTDRIHDTINYKDIYKEIIDFCSKHSPRLLEKLGGDLIEHLLRTFREIQSIKIQVFKPTAIPSAKRTGIEISKKRF